MFMRKYIVFNLAIFYGIVLSYLIKGNSYAYEMSNVVYPEGVTTVNFDKYNGNKSFVRVCSYDNCLDYTGGTDKSFMKGFRLYLDGVSENEYRESIYNRGYPITKIYYSKD